MLSNPPALLGLYNELYALYAQVEGWDPEAFREAEASAVQARKKWRKHGLLYRQRLEAPAPEERAGSDATSSPASPSPGERWKAAVTESAGARTGASSFVGTAALNRWLNKTVKFWTYQFWQYQYLVPFRVINMFLYFLLCPTQFN